MSMLKFKMNRAVCSVDHVGKVPAQKIAGLPESQAGAFRHRCAACAYQLGYEEGLQAAAREQRVTSSRLLKSVAKG